MITATFDLKCDSCSRENRVTFEGILCAPELRTMLLSIGWDRYLQGTVLCSECVQNYEHMERVERVITKSALINDKPKEIKKSRTNEEILIALQEANGVKSRAARNVGLSVPQFFVRCKKMRDENNGKLPELNGKT